MPLFNCSECHSPSSIEIFVIYDTDVAVFLDIDPQEMRKKRRLRSACAYAQADQSLRCLHLPSFDIKQSI